MIEETRNDTPEAASERGWYLVFAAWLVALASTLGSLYFSEGMGIEPCEFCWYQRVFMYALVPVLLVGLFPLDRRISRYGLPLAIAGLFAATYHLLLQSGFIAEDLVPCSQDLSCSNIDWEWLGFLTLPMLSMLSFLVIIALLLIFATRVIK